MSGRRKERIRITFVDVLKLEVLNNPQEPLSSTPAVRSRNVKLQRAVDVCTLRKLVGLQAADAERNRVNHLGH